MKKRYLQKVANHSVTLSSPRLDFDRSFGTVDQAKA